MSRLTPAFLALIAAAPFIYAAAMPAGHPPTAAPAIKDKVHPHDLHATILQCMGLDHTKLTYRFNGRDFRLTDGAGNVLKPLLA